MSTKKRIIHRKLVSQEGDWADVSPLLQQIYAQRGIASHEGIETELNCLASFEGLSNIEEASELIYDAMYNQRRIMVVGDYDVDGATSTALAVSVLKDFGAEDVDFILPDRFKDGYGLSPGLVKRIQERNGADLLITVDNGIASIDGVAAARAAGMKVLVTDHHLAGEKIPEDCVIVDPNLPGDEFPSKNLAGVGVIFYVMLACRAYCKKKNYFEEMCMRFPGMAKYLDLVALGTVADVVPLDKNNRILIQQGLLRIRRGQTGCGIKALAKIARRNLKNMVASDCGYSLGPRLNAAGRLQDMTIGVRCLLTEDPEQARDLAKQLDELNRARRSKEAEMQTEALEIVTPLQKNDDLPVGICLCQDDWHEGIIGLVASKIKDKCYRPIIAFAKTESGELKGSGRSIVGLHMRDSLSLVAVKYPDLIIKYGGHAMAAGLSIHEENLEKFKNAWIEALTSQLQPETLRDDCVTDGPLAAEQLTLPIARELRDGGPWGQSFPEPMFDNVFEIMDQRIVGEKHLRVRLREVDSGVCFTGIWFNMDEDLWPNTECKLVHAVYKLDVNDYQEIQSLQLMIMEMFIEEETTVVEVAAAVEQCPESLPA